LFINRHDIDYVNGLLEKNNLQSEDRIVIIAPAAGGANRRWEKEKFAQVAERLSKDYKVILVGRESDKPVAQYIRDSCKAKVLDFSGLTTLKQLAYLIQKASLVIVCDTGVLQLASYLDAPILALFGASDERKYGPWSHKKTVISRELFCRRCREAQCRFGTTDCMRLIRADEVVREAENVLSKNYNLPVESPKYDFKRILIVRTDRIGDVLLSTPVIKALRGTYPNAYIAMMVSPYAKDIIDGNPYLDEVIIYDKDGKHKSWGRSLKFSLRLKKRRFDLALVLHPTNRVHLVSCFAGIPRRVGYDRKLGFLLTDKIEHTKHLGQKHELEYNLDLLRHLGIEPKDKTLYIPIKKESEEWTDELFREEAIAKSDKLLAIHPAASCPSKVWPAERFSKVADRLAERYGFKVLIIAGPKDIVSSKVVLENMRHSAVYLGGRTSVSQLASILKRCRLFISNDSGPVHIASAVGTPVISIFGRNQKGLSPKRWGPVGDKDKVLHKEVGCIECLAHNCVKSFACLKAIEVEDVVNAADAVLKS
jgi:lipopolysaccharide heptosyltransferase II